MKLSREVTGGDDEHLCPTAKNPINYDANPARKGTMKNEK